MDHRVYFIIGDLVANMLVGALMAIAALLFIGDGWNMVVAMVAMMALAMLLSLFLSLALGILFGGMEIMVPAMLSGMFGGMFAAMRLAMAEASLAQLAGLGAGAGLIVICIVWAVNARIRGVQPLEG